MSVQNKIATYCLEVYNKCLLLSGGKLYDSKVLQPLLNDLEGYYQIGPAQHCCETFVLSVTIAFAANLAQVNYNV